MFPIHFQYLKHGDIKEANSKSSFFSSVCSLEDKRNVITSHRCPLRSSFLSCLIKVTLSLSPNRIVQIRKREEGNTSQDSSEVKTQKKNTNKTTRNLNTATITPTRKTQIFISTAVLIFHTHKKIACIRTEYLCLQKQASEQAALYAPYVHAECTPRVTGFCWLSSLLSKWAHVVFPLRGTCKSAFSPRTRPKPALSKQACQK